MRRWFSVVGTAARSAVRTPVELHRLRWSGPRFGHVLFGPDGGRFRVFRDTGRAPGGPGDAEQAVVVVAWFRLAWLGRAGSLRHRLFRRVCVLTFPLFSGLPGYRVKLWAGEIGGTRYLGVYEWAGERAARAYLAALLPLLEAVGAPGSVGGRILPDFDLASYLRTHDASVRRDTAA